MELYHTNVLQDVDFERGCPVLVCPGVPYGVPGFPGFPFPGSWGSLGSRVPSSGLREEERKEDHRVATNFPTIDPPSATMRCDRSF